MVFTLPADPQARTDKHIIDKIGNLLLSEIDTGIVTSLRNRLYKEGFAGSTINKVLGCFKAILESAEKNAYYDTFPGYKEPDSTRREKAYCL